MTVIKKLQKLQNRAAKLVTNSAFDAPALPVIRALQWPTVREFIDFESQKMVFRSLKGDAPSYMNDMFTRVNTNCDFKDPKNKNTKLLKQLYNEYQLEQLMKDHTRVAVRATKESEHHTSKTLIDHFSTNKSRYILSSGVIKSGMVDHFMIYAIRKVNAWRIRSKKIKNS